MTYDQPSQFPSRNETSQLEQISLLQGVINALPLPFFFKDIDGFYRSCNKGFEEITGLPAAQIIGKSIYDIAPAEKAAKYSRMDRELLRDPGCREYEASVKFADGSRREMIFHKSTLLDNNSAPAGIVGLLIDITERKRAEKELEKYRLHLEKLVEERTWQLKEANQGLSREIFQREQANKILQRHDAILKAVSSSARQLMLLESWEEGINDVLERIGEQAEISRIYVFRHRAGADNELFAERLFEWTAPGFSPRSNIPALQNFSYRKNGLASWEKELKLGRPVHGLTGELPTASRSFIRDKSITSIAIVPVMVDAKPWGLIGLENDHEERPWTGTEIDALKTAANIIGAAVQRQKLAKILQKSRARYRAVVDDQTELICRYKSDGVITFMNNAFCRYFGEKRSQLIGNNCKQFILNKDLREFDRLLASLNQENPAATMEYRIRLPNRKIRWQRWTVRALFDEQGGFVEYQAVGRDVTDRRMAEEALKKAHDHLEDRVRERSEQLEKIYNQLLHKEKLSAIGTLSASIAHEFGSPVFGIRNFLETLESRDTFSPTDRELIHLAIQECNRLKALIDNLKDLSRPTSGVMAPADINGIIAGVLLLCREQFHKKRIDLITNYDDKIPPVRLVRDQIKQVIINIVKNAEDAIPEEGGVIEITTELIGTGIMIHIKNSGRPIDAEVMDHIFEPFFSTKSVAGGTGLGLTICCGILSRHNATIDFKSEPGDGTTFSIALPLNGSS